MGNITYLLKGNLPTEYEWITPFDSVVSGKEGKNCSNLMCYKHITLHRGQHSETDPFRGNVPSECCWITPVEQFTDCQCSKLVRKWKQALLDTHNRRLITYTSSQRLLTSWVWELSTHVSRSLLHVYLVFLQGCSISWTLAARILWHRKCSC